MRNYRRGTLRVATVFRPLAINSADINAAIVFPYLCPRRLCSLAFSSRTRDVENVKFAMERVWFSVEPFRLCVVGVVEDLLQRGSRRQKFLKDP